VSVDEIAGISQLGSWLVSAQKEIEVLITFWRTHEI
jgi:hypothetical protein